MNQAARPTLAGEMSETKSIEGAVEQFAIALNELLRARRSVRSYFEERGPFTRDEVTAYGEALFWLDDAVNIG